MVVPAAIPYQSGIEGSLYRLKGMESSKDQFKIYFLSLEGKLPKWYPNLSLEFSKFGVSLIPIDFKDFKYILEEERCHIILSETGFYGKNLFKKSLKGFLGFSIRNTSNYFHHISSFAMDRDKYDLKQKNKKKYYYYRMPFAPEVFAQHISSFLIETLEEKFNWPGGKRAKLPNG